MKGFVLAAGLGTRLRPYTCSVPKPLFPVLGIPVLGWALAALRQAGVREAVVNLHHLPDAVVGWLARETPDGMWITCSREDAILGTGGALVAAAALLGEDSPFLLHNGDIFDDWDLSRLRSDSGPVLGIVDGDSLAESDRRVELAPDGSVRSLRGLPAPGNGRRVVYGGAALITRPVIDRLRKAVPGWESGRFSEACLIADGLIPMLSEGARVGTFEYDDRWYCDIGTPESYLELNRRTLAAAPDLLAVRGFPVPGQIEPGVYVEKGARVAAGVRFTGPVLVRRDAVVEAGAIVGPDVTVCGTVRGGCIVSDAVVMAGASAGGRVSGIVVP